MGRGSRWSSAAAWVWPGWRDASTRYRSRSAWPTRFAAPRWGSAPTPSSRSSSSTAALISRGDAGRGAITQLAEQLDGRTLFGERLEALDPARFSTQADRLGVVAVVALEDDDTQLGWLAESTAFRRRLALAPFVVFARESAVALPTARDGAWRIALAGEAGGWTSARIAYYP